MDYSLFSTKPNVMSAIEESQTSMFEDDRSDIISVIQQNYREALVQKLKVHNKLSSVLQDASSMINKETVEDSINQLVSIYDSAYEILGEIIKDTNRDLDISDLETVLNSLIKLDTINGLIMSLVILDSEYSSFTSVEKDLKDIISSIVYLSKTPEKYSEFTMPV